MTKETSQLLKGVAILFMIYLHLFNQISNVDLCHNLFIIDNLPIIYILTRAANPIPFFLILSGYGLYKVNVHGDKNKWSRILKLFFHWWIIMIIFITIGYFIDPSEYPGSFVKFILNGIGYWHSYNNEMWFLLPFTILSSFSFLIFYIVKKFNWKLVFTCFLILYIISSFIISRYLTSFLYNHNLFYILIITLQLSFNFTLGVLAAKHEFFNKFKSLIEKKLELNKKGWLKNAILLIGIFTLICLNCVFKYNYLYAFLFITLLTQLDFPKSVSTILVKLGDQSMNMWMIHTWFCYYLFHNFIYSFKYPILIFLVLTTISYLCSLVINQIVKPVERIFLTPKEIKQKPIL